MDKLRVLVVDDEESVRDFIGLLLERRGDDASAADCGLDALSLLAEKEFDLLITDLRMPGMDGLELIREAHKSHPGLLTIVLTGMGTRGDMISAIKENVFDFAEKPVRAEALSLILDRASDQARLVRQRDQLLEDLQRQNEKLENNLAVLENAYEKLMRQEEALEADLERAQRMQQNLLPSAFPRIENTGFFGYYRPCERLGGDFFDIVPLSNSRAAVYLADVVGHGVRAAMVTVIVRELIHGQLLLHPDDPIFEHPSQALDFLNRGLLEETFHGPMHVTMAYVVVDGEAGTVTYSCAGHPSPILVSGAGEAHRLQAAGPALGIEPAATFETGEHRLGDGDFLLVYSDGLTEARNADARELGVQCLETQAAKAHGLPPREVGCRLGKLLGDHLKRLAPSDDVSFVVIGGGAVEEAENGEPAPTSVRIVSADFGRLSPGEQGRIEAGWADRDCVIRIVGRGTWGLSHALSLQIDKALQGRADSIYLDLSNCESLDSTMLGLLTQSAPDLALSEPSLKVIAEFHELGIFERLRFADGPVPQTRLRPIAASDPGREARGRAMLSAHETLMEASEKNRETFGPVIRSLRLEITPSGSGAELSSLD